MVLFPYTEKRKVGLKLTEDQKAMLIFDVFKGQITDKVTNLSKRIIVIVRVLNNMTDEFQPLDLNINGHAKEFLKVQFEFWYAQQITNQLVGEAVFTTLKYHWNFQLLNRFMINGY